MRVKALIALSVIYGLSAINALLFIYYQGVSYLNNGILNPYAALLELVVILVSVVIWQVCFIVLMFCRDYSWLPHLTFILIVGFVLLVFFVS